MGFFSRFENKMEDTLEGAADKMSHAPISPVQIAKKAEKEMRREKMVGAGKQYAPTLYTVLVNPDDDCRLFGYYPTLAGETETYLKAKAASDGLVMDGNPLVRFVVDEGLKHGKFDVIAEVVAAVTVEQLRDEEFERYGITPRAGYRRPSRDFDEEEPTPSQAYEEYEGEWDEYAPSPAPEPGRKPPLPYVPEDEIDYSIDYGEYTFNSEDFEDYREKVEVSGRHGSQKEESSSQPIPERVSAQFDGDSRAQVVENNTVVFADGSRTAVMPNRHIVQARLIDRVYHRAFDLAGSHITIGRESDNDIVVQDINASRKHAMLRLTNQGVWTITDQGSLNGTLVNGFAVASQALNSGDIITIGKTEFEFTLR